MKCTWQSLGGRLQGLTPPRTATNIMIWRDNKHENILMCLDNGNAFGKIMIWMGNACISYLVIGFIFSKGAVSATPDYGLWWWVEPEAFGGSQGVLGVSGDVWVSDVWCLVSVVWCLVKCESVRKAPSPFFSLAIPPKPCWAHWYNLPLILLAAIVMWMRHKHYW